MEMRQDGGVSYSIFDPTGNITALVEGPVEPERYAPVASAVMRRHPAVEQVGFFSVKDGRPALAMAGGEFCGNASMCAAALYLLRTGESAGEDWTFSVPLAVSGAAEPVSVTLRPEGDESFAACVRMPRALSVTGTVFSFGGIEAALPLVRMEGISHILVESSSPFFALKGDRQTAESAVRAFCDALGADCLGLMFLEREAGVTRLTPLVYVPGSGTIFWENSCASGSAAVGMALSERAGGAVDLTLYEPGGSLRVVCDAAGEALLYGRTRRIGAYRGA